MEQTIIHIKDVKKWLNWPSIYHVVEQALISVSVHEEHANVPSSNQPARTLTHVDSAGILFSMPGYIKNYTLPSSTETFSTLACKLVTSFPENSTLPTPIPSILANILLFDRATGQLKAIIEGNEITAWRTAAASLVATKHLYFNRCPQKTETILAIIGCSTQGRIHAIGMCCTFNISKVHLWNRTKSKAVSLVEELNHLKDTFIDKNVQISVFDETDECVKEADIIVTATYTSSPLVHFDSIKKDAHINAVGAGQNHHSELDEKIYSNSMIYVDNFANAANELKTLNHEIEGEVGQVIIGEKIVPKNKITIFHSMGMAVEDCVAAQMVYEGYLGTK